MKRFPDKRDTAKRFLIAAIFIAAALAPMHAKAQSDDSAAQAATDKTEPPAAVAPPEKIVRFINAKSEETGTATLVDMPTGVLVKLDLKGLPPGEHAIHFHQKALCDATNQFNGAGDHLNPEQVKHGYRSDEGPHPGDLPNIVALPDGTHRSEIFTSRLTLTDQNTEGMAALMDEDGAALIVHSGPDDYVTQPAGGSGDRIACAEIKE